MVFLIPRRNVPFASATTINLFATSGHAMGVIPIAEKSPLLISATSDPAQPSTATPSSDQPPAQVETAAAFGSKDEEPDSELTTLVSETALEACAPRAVARPGTAPSASE